jgi:hypothetical protein
MIDATHLLNLRDSERKQPALRIGVRKGGDTLDDSFTELPEIAAIDLSCRARPRSFLAIEELVFNVGVARGAEAGGVTGEIVEDFTWGDSHVQPSVLSRLT